MFADGTFYIAPIFGYQVSNYNNNIIVIPKILRCDFEKSISNASIKIFHNITIKYCVWYY
ncbi:hypothetical protein H8356DRAFT_1675527, partial [Neocallimastix lanati (nom. inval.)]